MDDPSVLGHAYVLGSSEGEHQRLMRQALTLAPTTQRLFIEAGVRPGMRVLEIGCGVGDVTQLTAALVTATGTVTGLDRDASSLARARVRTAHLPNVHFIETDLSNPKVEGIFDVIVGRFVLMFLPNPVATLRALTNHLRPGGVLACQEASWSSFFSEARHLPLHTRCGELACETLRRGGAEPNMSLILYRGVQDAGFEQPTMRVETLLARMPEDRAWLPDLLETMRPRWSQLGISTQLIGDPNTLGQRLHEEIQRENSFTPLVGLVGAWARKAP
jgi:SAM-dependent methyltransferase